MFPIYDPTTALKTILKRQPLDESDVPASMLERIEKTFGERLTPDAAVQRILRDVRNEGDPALLRWTEKIDQITLQHLRLPVETIQAAPEKISAQQKAVLAESIARVEAFHRRQPLTSWITHDMGGTLGQMIRPIQRVGIYVPGGTAPLPSSVIMSVVPAKVAGVPEICVVTPPNRHYPGYVPDVILAACAMTGVQEVYTLGGAQAIAALAFGTHSLPPVAKIFGPGNLFVTMAKRQVYGTVGIDGLFGPTETMVIADESANPAWVAADLLAQAEHDVLASAILLTPSSTLAQRVQQEIERQVHSLPRQEICLVSLQNRSGAVLVRDLDEALELANAYAAEHLCLAVAEPWRLAERVQNAGGVFLGEYSFEVLGDYIAGPSHAMPTGGSARFSSPLNVWDFTHIVSLVALDRQTGAHISAAAAAFARAESLEAHARAADLRNG